jgi:hypothetical protein
MSLADAHRRDNPSCFMWNPPLARPPTARSRRNAGRPGLDASHNELSDRRQVEAASVAALAVFALAGMLSWTLPPSLRAQPHC